MAKTTLRYHPGTTNRITVTSVREDVCTYNTDTPEALHRFWVDVIAKQPDHEPDKEAVVVVMMNARLRPHAWHRVSLGSVSECSAHPREIFRPVIAAGAYGFALTHNHPSGDPSPSRADEAITRRINEAATLLQIRLIDHVIIGEPAPGRQPYFSFKEAGLLG
jgi:DNA repair protein RadC